MNISSVVLRAHPRRIDEVKEQLSALPGVELHAADEGGRLVLSLEDTGTARAADTFVKLHDIRGVMSVAMIYQYSES